MFFSRSPTLTFEPRPSVRRVQVTRCGLQQLQTKNCLLFTISIEIAPRLRHCRSLGSGTTAARCSQGSSAEPQMMGIEAQMPIFPNAKPGPDDSEVWNIF